MNTWRYKSSSQAGRAASSGANRRLRFAKKIVAAALLVVLLVLAGCSPATVDNTYGRRRGINGGASVNGTGVLSDMFEQAGFKVHVWRRLSPRLERSDVIVWANDDFGPPNDEQREFLETWLANKDGRTLVYIGRDYDALPTYWSKVLPTAPPEQAAEIARKRAKSIAARDWERISMPKEKPAHWFTIRRDGKLRNVRALKGPWSDGIDASKVEIEIEGRLDPMKQADIPTNANGNPEYDLPETSEVLLESNGDVLVNQVSDGWYDSKIIVVANGSFLLNLPLVNHEHRKLAGKLVDACGPPGSATFLESGPFGLPVHKRDPDTNRQSGFEWLIVWPLGAILLHVLSFSILLCFALYPIFGRPRHLESDPTGDFGKHIGALGELLQQTNDEDYARERLAHYHQYVKRESGAGSLDRMRSKSAASPITPAPATAAPTERIEQNS